MYSRKELGEPAGGGLPILVSALDACRQRLATRLRGRPSDIDLGRSAPPVDEVLRWCLGLLDAEPAAGPGSNW